MSIESGPGPAGGSGQYGAYVPQPTAAPRRSSPWLYVGLGCGLMSVILFGGCAVGFFALGKKVSQVMNQPLDKAQLAKDLSDIPLYPGAKLDEKTSKTVGSAFAVARGIMKSTNKNMTFAAYVTPDDDTKVLAWYDAAMPKAGYAQKSTSKTSENGRVSAQRIYTKGNVIILVQIPQEAGGASFYLIRLQGLNAKQTRFETGISD